MSKIVNSPVFAPVRASKDHAFPAPCLFFALTENWYIVFSFNPLIVIDVFMVLAVLQRAVGYAPLSCWQYFTSYSNFASPPSLAGFNHENVTSGFANDFGGPFFGSGRGSDGFSESR